MLPAWMPGPVVSGGFREGNAVRLPEGGAGLLLRCRVYDKQGRMYDLQHACFFKLRPRPAASGRQGQQAAVGPLLVPGAHSGSGLGGLRHLQQQADHGQPPQQEPVPEAASPLGALAWQGFVSMPGGGNKFIVRYDAGTAQYLALTNPSIDRYGSNPDARNILVLVSSGLQHALHGTPHLCAAACRQAPLGLSCLAVSRCFQPAALLPASSCPCRCRRTLPTCWTGESPLLCCCQTMGCLGSRACGRRDTSTQVGDGSES